MTATILTDDELTREDIESFWAQNVCMDDWDYIILAPVETLHVYEGKDEWHDNAPCTVCEQTEWTLDRLLVGCCSNKWYRATFRGTLYAVGVAYHA